MAVIFTMLAAVSFYTAAIPVKFALVSRIANGAAFGAGLSLFEGRYALKRAGMRSRGEKEPLFRQKRKPEIDKRAAVPAALKSGKYLLRHVRLEKLDVRGRLCLSDAAHTALACGCLRSLEGALLTASSGISLRPEPDFSAGHSDLSLCGMVSVRAGHIILAALIGTWTYMTRRYSHGKVSD